MASTAEPARPARPRGLALLRAALGTRKASCMLGFGFSSGLPYALLIGTLNAWLGEVGINLATIGVLSWIGLSYSFKFLWSPLVDRLRLPGLERLGRRKSWVFLCQATLVVAFVGLWATDPAHAIGRFALIAFIAALASATQDVAIDAWRIDVADEAAPVELLSAIYQFGYRVASIVGGALALVLAARLAWPTVYALMALLVALVGLLTLAAPDTPRSAEDGQEARLSESGELAPAARALALILVLVSWAWAINRLIGFMLLMLDPAIPGARPPSVADFTRHTGPWIVAATVAVPLAVAAIAHALKARGIAVLAQPDEGRGPVRATANHLYAALVSPLAELVGRIGWGVPVVFGLILTYTLCYNIWGSFAFPFYLNFLKYSKDEVAFASKLFGIFMTMLGIGLGGYAFARLGRMPTILVGAILPVLGNFVYADLAEGARHIDAVGRLTGLNALFGLFGFDARMVRLLLAIAFENVSTGLAGAAFVAYLSSIVARQYAAVQYALLSSLTFLIGSLGRGIAGEAFDRYGYATTFRWTAAAGLVAVVFVLLEWARSGRTKQA
jgi:PAT family beta-lactamase induction signal transducer AmpG